MDDEELSSTDRGTFGLWPARSGNRIRVLVVDDVEASADLIAEFLARERDHFEIHTETDPTSVVDQLDAVDCIVSDYDMAPLDGMELLDRVRSRDETFPFILLTGKGSERIASKAIGAGVTDYLQKGGTDRYPVLANRIEHAVSTHRARRAQTLFETLTEASMDSIMVIQPDETIAFASVTEDSTIDSSGDELVGRTFTSIVASGARDRISRAFDTVVAGEETFETEVRMATDTWCDLRLQNRLDDDQIHGVVATLKDISDRKQREAQLETINDRLDTIVSTLPVIVFAIDQDGTFTLSEGAALADLGHTPGEVVGKHVEDVYAEMPEILSTVERVLDGEFVRDTLEVGGLVFESTYQPRFDEDGSVTGLVGVAIDVTDRIERERELERYETIVQAAGDPMYTLDADARFEFVNEALIEMSGYDRDTLIGSHASLIMNEDDIEIGTDLIRELLSEGGRHGTHELDIYTADGQRIPCENHLVLLPFEDDFRGTAGVIRDISDRKQRERELRTKNRAIDDAPVGIAISDLDDGTAPFIYVNEEFQTITGYATDELLGEDWHLLFGETTAEEHVEMVDGAIHELRSASIRLRAKRRTGSEFWCHLQLAPVVTDDGTVTNIVGFVRDVTETIERRQQLAVLDRVLRHNLRNDMNKIIGNAQNVCESATGEVAEYGHEIITVSEQLLNLVEKERAIAQQLDDPQPVQSMTVGELVLPPIDGFRDRFPEVPIDVHIDETSVVHTIPQVRQAVGELLENAVEHAEREDPSVSLTASVSDANLSIRIADNGPGIPNHERDVLRDDNEIDALYHGSGAGLWLVKWIVNQAGGTLTFHENEPRGTVVEVMIPREHHHGRDITQSAGEPAG